MRDGVPYVKTYPTEDDYFDEYVLAGIPVQRAREFARQDAADVEIERQSNG